MEFKLEIQKYQQRVEELESTVEKLRHQLKLSNADAGHRTEDEASEVADVTNDNVDGSSVQQHEEVNLLCC